MRKYMTGVIVGGLFAFLYITFVREPPREATAATGVVGGGWRGEQPYRYNWQDYRGRRHRASDRHKGVASPKGRIVAIVDDPVLPSLGSFRNISNAWVQDDSGVLRNFIFHGFWLWQLGQNQEK